jgi:hypothetical protein
MLLNIASLPRSRSAKSNRIRQMQVALPNESKIPAARVPVTWIIPGVPEKRSPANSRSVFGRG